MRSSFSQTPPSCLGSLSDPDLQGALDGERKELSRAIETLRSTNEGPSDLTNLRARVRDLETRVQALEQEAINRMSRTEQIALRLFSDYVPLPLHNPSQSFDLPSDLLKHRLFPFMSTEDLVRLSQASRGGMAAEARLALEETTRELRRLADLFPSLREVVESVIQQPKQSWGEAVQRFQNRLGEFIGSNLRELEALYGKVGEDVAESKNPPRKRALQLIKDVLVQRIARHLHLASPALLCNREFMLAALRENSMALEYADPQLGRDRKFILHAVQRCFWALNFADPELRRDPEIVMAAVQRFCFALGYADPELRRDPEIVMAAVQRFGFALGYADPELRRDPEIVMAAVLRDGTALRYADPALRGDPEIVMAAVRQDGLALEHASSELRRDPEIVMAAVLRDGTALRYADRELRRDREFVMSAVRKDCFALAFADSELQGDRGFVLAAVWRSGRGALRWAAPELTRDLRMVLAAGLISLGAGLLNLVERFWRSLR
jgi:hypothetical protein